MCAETRPLSIGRKKNEMKTQLVFQSFRSLETNIQLLIISTHFHIRIFMCMSLKNFLHDKRKFFFLYIFNTGKLNAIICDIPVRIVQKKKK